MTISKKLTGILLTTVLLAGCYNQFSPVKVRSEDRATATVKVGYIHKVPRHRTNPFVDVVDKANSVANQYCQKNGYNEANRLEKSRDDCIGHRGIIFPVCNKYVVTFKYQCVSS